MRTDRTRIDWAGFLGRPMVDFSTELANLAARDKSVLITGAGGSIGSNLAQAVAWGRPRALVLLDLSESGLYESCRQLAGFAASFGVEVVPIVGSVADRRLLKRILETHRPDLILHAAAYKHVPFMERNPFSAMANNAIGTYRVATAAAEAGVSHLVMVSTDKAVDPIGIMGASKRLAELAVLSHATKATRMNAVRLGNVLGSSGSVVPLFQEQAASGSPFTVAAPAAARYFLTPEEADAAILQAAGSCLSGKILIPACGESIQIVKLASYLAGRCGRYPRIEYIGLRPGDKLREELLSSAERVDRELAGGMRVVSSAAPDAAEVATAMARLENAIDTFHLPGLIRIVQELVPAYRPSEQLLRSNLLQDQAIAEAQ